MSLPEANDKLRNNATKLAANKFTSNKISLSVFVSSSFRT